MSAGARAGQCASTCEGAHDHTDAFENGRGDIRRDGGAADARPQVRGDLVEAVSHLAAAYGKVFWTEPLRCPAQRPFGA